MDKYIITGDTLRAITNYLKSCPYEQVAQIFSLLATLEIVPQEGPSNEEILGINADLDVQ